MKLIQYVYISLLFSLVVYPLKSSNNFKQYGGFTVTQIALDREKEKSDISEDYDCDQNETKVFDGFCSTNKQKEN